MFSFRLKSSIHDDEIIVNKIETPPYRMFGVAHQCDRLTLVDRRTQRQYGL